MKKLFLLLLLLTQQAVHADVLVLVHGYRSNAATWDRSGITSVLAASGWRYAVPGQRTDKTLYAIELPAHAPLMIQTGQLLDFLNNIRRNHANEKLIVAGHSAGGVVSRLSTLNGNSAGIDALITIASPHLGTFRASQALDIVDSKPFFCPGPGIDFLKSVVGGDDYEYLKHSRYTLADLLPPSSGNLLTWANSYPHPDIKYHSVVRYNPNFVTDDIVPAFSQDMNLVPALSGKVKVWQSNAGHGLNPGDGHLLLAILNQL